MLTIIIRYGGWPRAAGSSTTSTQCWPSSSGMESGRGQLVHQQHHPASFCWLGRVWQQGREKSGASTLREVLFSKADSPSWWPDEDLKQLTWKSFPGNDNIQFYIHHFSFPKFSFCAFWNFHSVLDKESQDLKVLVPNKFWSKTCLWLQWRDKFQRSWTYVRGTNVLDSAHFEPLRNYRHFRFISNNISKCPNQPCFRFKLYHRLQNDVLSCNGPRYTLMQK